MLDVGTRHHDDIDLRPYLCGPVSVSRTIAPRVEVGAREGEAAQPSPLEQDDSSRVPAAFSPRPDVSTILKALLKVGVVVLNIRPDHSIRIKIDNVVPMLIKGMRQSVQAQAEVVVAIARAGQMGRVQSEELSSIARAEVQVQLAAGVSIRVKLFDHRGPSIVYQDTVSLRPT